MAKQKITRISAKDPNKPSEKEAKKVIEVPKDTTKVAEKPAKKDQKPKKEKKEKKVFILFRPFVALGRYFKDSWLELRQVRWPNRKTTWKMVFAVIAYTVVFVVVIMLLDALFTLLFNLLLG